MGEAYIVRRGGVGGDGVGGQSNIFFQTTQPPTTNGGLWVKTTLTKYSIDSTIQPSGTLTGVGYEYNTSGSPYVNVSKSSNTIYGNFGYNSYGGSEERSSDSEYFNFYLVLFKINLANGVTSKMVNSLFSESWHYNSGKSAGAITIFGYNNVLYCFYYGGGYSTQTGLKKVSISNNAVTTSSAGHINNSYIGCVTENNLIPYFSSISNTCYLYNCTSDANSSIGQSVYSAMPIGTDNSGKIVYLFTRTFGQTTSTNRSMYVLNYSTGVYTLKGARPSNITVENQPLGYFSGICYFMSNNNTLYGYNTSSNTYSNLSIIVKPGSSTSTNGISGNYGWIGNSSISQFSISGNRTATDTVYITTGGSKNYARIIHGEGGNTDVPISGVYTVVNGKLTVFAEAYVSTGGAWTKVTY